MSDTKISEAIRNLIVCDTQFGWNGETTLKLPELLDLQARGWLIEGDDNCEFSLTEEGHAVVARALQQAGPTELAGQRVVGITADWVLGYLTTDAPEESREAIRNAFTEWNALAATGKQQVGEHSGWNAVCAVLDDLSPDWAMRGAPLDTESDQAVAAIRQLGEVPTFDAGLESWLRDRDLMPDYHNGQIEMEEVIEALNEHERMLMLSAQAGEVQ